MEKNFHTIYLPTRPQTDTIIAIFILKKLGKEEFPGVEDAEVAILSQVEEGKSEKDYLNDGCVLIDIGGGRFDHHTQGETATHAIADYLGLLDYPPLQKLIQIAERDDKYGKGIISKDRLDRAFGLPGLIMALNKSTDDNADLVVRSFLPIIWGHYHEECRRTIELPEEFKQLEGEGKVKEIHVDHKGKNLFVMGVESNSKSIAGWLRAYKRADVVVQKNTSGHAIVLTNPRSSVDLSGVAAEIRAAESGEKKDGFDKPGRIDEVPYWYYDTATNSLLNGGSHASDVEPSSLTLAVLLEKVKKGLGEL
ncbi:MAG: hypothetical protein WDZ70_00450 [Candidatus Paceibacterota bacterium]